MKKDERQESSLTKHSSATAWGNVKRILRQLHEDKKKVLRVEFHYHFGRKSDGSILVEPTSIPTAAAAVADTTEGKSKKKKKTQLKSCWSSERNKHAKTLIWSVVARHCCNDGHALIQDANIMGSIERIKSRSFRTDVYE